MVHSKIMRYYILILLLAVNFALYAQKNNYDMKGLKAGFWVENNDSITFCGNYKLGKKEGSWAYYKNNKIVKVLNFSNDTLFGISMSFNADGSIHRKFKYENGKLNGQCEFYSSKGELLAKYEYLNNTILRVDLYIIDKETPPRSHDYTPTL